MMDTDHGNEQGTIRRTGRIKRRLTFSTPVAGIACGSCPDDVPRANGGTRRPCKNARMCSSPFSFGVSSRDTNVPDTPTMNLASSHPSRNRFSLRPKRAARQAGTQQGACRFRNLQSGTQHSWPEQIQSPAVLCTEMLPARIVQAETRAGTTATVYQTLFGCPPEFAAIADVVPESQGASLTNLDTPSDIGNMQTTPTSLFAFSVLTEKSDVPFLKNSADTHQGMFTTMEGGPENLGAFGSPAETGVTPAAGMAVEAHDMSSAEALAMNAQAGNNFSVFAAAFPSLSQLRSPWHTSSNRSSCRSAGTSDGFVVDGKKMNTAFGGDSHASVAQVESDVVDLIPAQLSGPFGSSFGTCSQQLPNDTCAIDAENEDLIPAAYGPFDPASPLRNDSPLYDSDSALGDSPGFCEMSEDSDCEEHDPTGFSNHSIDLLAATLGNRFETLLLSPDNQVPLLHNSLGRKVSAHGGFGETHAEPWGRKAVFGSRSTGRNSRGSQAGSASLHGLGTLALKLARSERRAEHAPDGADVKTPLTVCSSKEDVLFTIGAPLDSKKKPSRLQTLSPTQCTAKLGVCMLEPAPVPQTMRTGTVGDTRSNTAASSPEPHSVFPSSWWSCSFSGGGVSPVSTVTLSLHSIFEQLHANPQDICDI